MGQQQLVLIILGIIIIGIALAVGLSMFSDQSVRSNKDAIISDIIHISHLSYQYTLKPKSQGGGGGSYAGYTLPSQLVSNANGTYAIVGTPATTIVVRGTSAQPGKAANTVTVTFSSSGQATNYAYTSEFL